MFNYIICGTPPTGCMSAPSLEDDSESKFQEEKQEETDAKSIVMDNLSIQVTTTTDQEEESTVSPSLSPSPPPSPHREMSTQELSEVVVMGFDKDGNLKSISRPALDCDSSSNSQMSQIGIETPLDESPKSTHGKKVVDPLQSTSDGTGENDNKNTTNKNPTKRKQKSGVDKLSTTSSCRVLERLKRESSKGESNGNSSSSSVSVVSQQGIELRISSRGGRRGGRSHRTIASAKDSIASSHRGSSVGSRSAASRQREQQIRSIEEFAGFSPNSKPKHRSTRKPTSSSLVKAPSSGASLSLASQPKEDQQQDYSKRTQTRIKSIEEFAGFAPRTKTTTTTKGILKKPGVVGVSKKKLVNPTTKKQNWFRRTRHKLFGVTTKKRRLSKVADCSSNWSVSVVSTLGTRSISSRNSKTNGDKSPVSILRSTQESSFRKLGTISSNASVPNESSTASPSAAAIRFAEGTVFQDPNQVRRKRVPRIHGKTRSSHKKTNRKSIRKALGHNTKSSSTDANPALEAALALEDGGPFCNPIQDMAPYLHELFFGNEPPKPIESQ